MKYISSLISSPPQANTSPMILPLPRRNGPSAEAVNSYQPDGAAATTDFPSSITTTTTTPTTSPSGDTEIAFSLCGPSTQTCSRDGICFPPSASQEDLPIQASCTSSTWTSADYPDFYTDGSNTEANSSSALALCRMRADETVYCRGHGSNQPSATQWDCNEETSSPVFAAARLYASISRSIVPAAPIASLWTTIFISDTASAPPLSNRAMAPSLEASQISETSGIVAAAATAAGEPSGATSQKVGIFSPTLSQPLKNLYSVMIVMGGILLVSLLLWVVVVLVAAVKGAYGQRFRRVKRHRGGSGSSMSDSPFGFSCGSHSRCGPGSSGWMSSIASTMASMGAEEEPGRVPDAGTFNAFGNPSWVGMGVSGGGGGSRRSSLRRSSAGSLAVVIEEEEEMADEEKGDEEKQGKQNKSEYEETRTVEEKAEVGSLELL